MGHTSTSVSLGCGLAHARDLAGDTYNVITVIGDGSLSGGLAFEGLNNAAELDSNLIIIVNDNDQSIAENHGGLYRNLADLRASNGACERNVFRAMGLDYRYLDTGNDVLALVDALQELRNIDHPIVLHVSTAKGKGFEPAQSDPERWHHVGPFDMATGRKLCPGHPSEPAPRTYSDITGEALSAAIERDPQVVGITAATPYIMGFTRFCSAPTTSCGTTCASTTPPQPSWCLARRSLAPHPRRTSRSLIYPCWADFPTCAIWHRPAWRNTCPC